MDSSSFFHDLSPGVDNDGTGIIVALAAARLLGAMKRNVSLFEFVLLCCVPYSFITCKLITDTIYECTVSHYWIFSCKKLIFKTIHVFFPRDPFQHPKTLLCLFFSKG